MRFCTRLVFLFLMTMFSKITDAGIVLSMSIQDSAMSIPEFKDVNEAVMWAHDKKADSYLMQKMDILITNHAINAIQNADLKHPEDALKWENQYKWCKLALEIMESYKDPGMTSEEYYAHYKIPTFLNKQDAVVWVYKTKYIEPMRRLLIRRIKELHELAEPHAGNINPEELKIVANLMAQVEDCETALNIMIEFKKNHIEGHYDEAMATLYVIPKFKSKKYAIAWAKKIKWQEDILVAVIKRKMDIQSILRNPPEDEKEIKRLDDEWRILDEAHKIMFEYKQKGIHGDNAQVGSVFYAGSVPVPRK